MLNSFTCTRKADSELTDFQKNLDKFLDGEYERVNRKCDELTGSEKMEEYHGLLLQMLEITRIREQAGIIEIKEERAWWHT